MKANAINIVLLSAIFLFMVVCRILDTLEKKKEVHNSESALIEEFRKINNSHIRWLMMLEEQNKELQEKLHGK